LRRPQKLRIVRHGRSPRTPMSVKIQTKPHPGLLAHFSQDSVLTMEFPHPAKDRSTEIISNVKPSHCTALAWPQQGTVVEAHCHNSEAAASHVSNDCGSRIGATRAQMHTRTTISSLQGAPVLEDCSKISISKLGKVIDSLEEKEGYVSKADVIAALRIKGNVDNSAESRGSQNLALSGARRSRPSSALEKVERYQFQTRPVSAGVSRQRRSVSATRLSKTEPTVASVDKEAFRQPASSIPMPNPRSRSRDRPLPRTVQRQKSVPAPSLLNFSRQYPGLRATMCW